MTLRLCIGDKSIMTSDLPHAFDNDVGMDTVFIILVLVTYLSTFASGVIDLITPEGLVFTACGVLYLALGIFTLSRLQQRWPVATYVHLSAQTLLGALIYYLSQGQGWLIMLPVLGQSMEVLPPRKRLMMLLLNLVIMIAVTVFLVEPWHAVTAPLSPWATVGFSVLQYGLAATFVVLFTLVAVREREARAAVEDLAQQLEAANAKLRAYTVQAEELATAKERNRLAREIHDGLGHYLTAINMQIQAGVAVLDHDRDRGLKALEQAQSLAQDGLTEVRRSVAALRTSPLDDTSLSEAVGRLVEASRSSGVAIRYTVNGEPYPLDSQVAMVIYRAAQEGLTNARKHAEAQYVTVMLAYEDDRVVLTVEDDGLGVEEPGSGFGLLGIRERLKLIDGQMQVETGIGQGFRLQVEVPTS
jgi:signal transduction histidine kinase